MATAVLGFSPEECDLFDALLGQKGLSVDEVVSRLNLKAALFVGQLVQSELARLEGNWLFPSAAAVAFRDAVTDLAEQD